MWFWLTRQYGHLKRRATAFVKRMYLRLRPFAAQIPPCRIYEGGGIFGDLWTCQTCGRCKYPEVFRCPQRRAVPFLTLPTNPWRSDAS